MKKLKLMEEDWDVLIILDACRYDFFEEMYDEYLNGRLEKKRSLGSSTPEWLVKNFPGRYSITYISTVPFINSKGIGLGETGSADAKRYSWTATEHFEKIIDVWLDGWDEKLGLVPPQEVNEAYFSIDPDGRTIIHYHQPHGPFISYRKENPKCTTRQARRAKLEQGGKKYFLNRFRGWIGPRVERMVGSKNVWRLRKFLDGEPIDNYEELWRKGRLNEIEEFYRDNLEIALRATSALTDKLEGKVVVTSDHGEALGEEGFYAHFGGYHIPSLIEVPWLELR